MANHLTSTGETRSVTAGVNTKASSREMQSYAMQGCTCRLTDLLRASSKATWTTGPLHFTSSSSLSVSQPRGRGRAEREGELSVSVSLTALGGAFQIKTTSIFQCAVCLDDRLFSHKVGKRINRPDLRDDWLTCVCTAHACT